MTKMTELIINIFNYLNKNVNYAVLRNYEGLPYSNTSRDIDIIIEQKELNKHKNQIHTIITNSGWQLVTYLNNGRLITYVCGMVCKDGVELVQLDFFLDTSVYGIILAEAKEFMPTRKFNGQLYHVSEEYEFLDKYLYNRAVGAPYPEKYQALREQVKNSELVKDKMKQVFGSTTMQQLDQMNRKQLLSQALVYNLKNRFFKTIYSVLQSRIIHLSSFLKSAVAPRIGFTGPDGAGKTTVIELLYHKLSPVFEKATVFFHFRPTLFPNLGETAKSAGLKKDVDREYHIPHRGAKNGKLSSFIRLCYYTLDYMVGFWIKVKPHGRLTRFVVFDRYYTDIIADSRRSGIFLNEKFLYCWGKFFIPRLSYNILLTADSDIILSRKQELSREGIEEIQQKLLYLSKKKGYYLIQNNGKAEEAVHQILKLIFEKQHLKNLKRLKHGKRKD
ncbi:MAG: hypothetical protein AB7E36_03710 [Salinivirgaceae bacterium]